VEASEAGSRRLRDPVREAVDECQAPRGRFGLIKAEKGDDTIYVD
jgi:hypothetical protein